MFLKLGPDEIEYDSKSKTEQTEQTDIRIEFNQLLRFNRSQSTLLLVQLRKLRSLIFPSSLDSHDNPNGWVHTAVVRSAGSSSTCSPNW